MPITFAICGCGSRGLEAYASYQKLHPEEMQIVAGADWISVSIPMRSCWLSRSWRT